MARLELCSEESIAKKLLQMFNSFVSLLPFVQEK